MRWSTQTLARYLNDPTLNEIFRIQQTELAASHLDIDLTSVYQLPIIAQQSAAFSKGMQEEIRTTYAQSLLNMTRVTAETNPAVFKAITSAMKNLGYNDLQLANARFLIAAGPINAYTFAVSKDHVDVVINDELLAIADPRMLQSVLEHELTHVIMSHPERGMQLMMMMEKVTELYFAAAPHMKSIVSGFKETLFTGMEDLIRMRMRMTYGVHDTEAKKVSKLIVTGRKKAYLKNANAIQKPAIDASQEEIIKESTAFLNSLIVNFQMLEVSKDKTDMLIMLRDKGILTDTKPGNAKDEQAYKDLVTLIQATVSRENEFTADLGAVSNGGHYAMARFFFRVSGGMAVPNSSKFPAFLNAAKEYDLVHPAGEDSMNPRPQAPPTYRSEVRGGVGRVQDQLAEMVSLLSPEELRSAMTGDNSDHPANASRATYAFKYARNHQIISFRNLFLRLMILREGIQNTLSETKDAALTSKLKIDLASLETDILKGATDFQTGRNPRMMNLLEYEIARLEESVILKTTFVRDPLLMSLKSKVDESLKLKPNDEFLKTYSAGLGFVTSAQTPTLDQISATLLNWRTQNGTENSLAKYSNETSGLPKNSIVVNCSEVLDRVSKL